MNESGSASANAHRARMQRGVATVCEYLDAEFPGFIADALERGSDGSARRFRTFRIQRGDETHLLRVTDEVLDLDAEGTGGLLQRFQVALRIRAENPGNVVALTTSGVCIEPL